MSSNRAVYEIVPEGNGWAVWHDGSGLVARRYWKSEAVELGTTHAIMAGLSRIVATLTAEPEATAREIYALMIGLEYQWLRTDGGFDYVAEWDRAVLKLLPDEIPKGEE